MGIGLLNQKKWPEFRNYQITSKGLQIEIKTNESYNKQILKFEELGFDEHIVNYQPSAIASGLFISIFFNVILVALLFSDQFNNINPSILTGISTGSAIAMGFWGRQLFRFEKLKFIKGEVNISFWYFKKFQNEVDDFIEQLKNAKMNYFRTNYLKIDENEEISYVKQRLLWLKSMEYISDVELKEWIEKAENRKVIKGF
jgi:hypothetical protein